MWKRKSDPLVENTLALVQGMAKAEIQRDSAPIEKAEPAELATRSNLPKPKSRLFDDDEELKARLSEFKAVQRKFEREREEFCARTMEKVRSSLGRNGV